MFLENIRNELARGKTNNVVSEQVRHKPACTVKEDGERLEILDLERRGIVLSMLPKQRRFLAYADCWFSHGAAQMSV